MFALVCPKCQHHNSIKNEYVNFCENCKKKLPNSFQELKKGNPNLDLETYRKKYGVPMNRTARKSLIPEEQKRKTKLKAISFVLIVLILAIAGGASYVLVFKESKSEQRIKTTADEVFANWKRKNYGAFGLSLQSPVELNREKIIISDDKIIHVVQAEAYAGQTDSGANLGTQMIMYSPGVNVDLEDAKLRVLQDISSTTGISKFQHEEKNHRNFDSKAARLFEGSFEIYSTQFFFKHLVAVKNNVVLEVYINYTDSPENRDIADKILRSVKIEDASKN